jgi:TRAP-type C4-dicarboxylate transport system permease small subunit
MVPMLNDMAGYLNIVMNLFFVYMLHEIIHVAAQPIPQLHMFWPLALLMGGMFGIMLYYLGKFRRAAKGEDDSDPPNQR